MGARVDATPSGRIGRVRGLYVDSVHCEPQWLLISLGIGLSRTVTVVPVAACVGKLGSRRIRVTVGATDIRDAPLLDLTRPFVPALERAYCEIYGVTTPGAAHDPTDRRSACTLVRNHDELVRVRSGYRPNGMPDRRAGHERRLDHRLYANLVERGVFEYPPGRIPPPRVRGRPF